MSEQQQHRGPNYWLSFVLIGLGVVFLLDRIDLLDAGDILEFWPVGLMAIGILKLVTSKFRDIWSSGILIFIGLIFFLDYQNVIYFSIWDLWPVALILIGIKIFFDQRRDPSERSDMEAVDADRLDVAALFGGREVRMNSSQFLGGNISVMFGGAEIDLREARTATGSAKINIFVMFGGGELYVPNNWKVVFKGLPLFGGFSDSRKNVLPEDRSEENTLFLTGFVMFGGFEVKS